MAKKEGRQVSQVHNPRSDTWVKRDAETGQFIGAQKQPYDGIPKEKQLEEGK